jgi:Mrp family chromosome partitioning ATPase
MSKIQEAINESRKRAQKVGLAATGSFKTLDLLPTAAPLTIDGLPKLTLDPNQMEHSCLLPFVNTKGATSAYMLLRTRLMQRMRENKWKSVMVTGTVPDDGKSTTAINVAVGISQDVTQAVLLVDLDLERPTIATSLGLERTTGLSDYLRGKAECSDIIYNTDAERLFLVPNFEKMGPSETILTPRMVQLFDYIKGLDPNLLIIFDMPPILSSDGVLAMAPHVDSLLLVISEDHTPRTLLKRANQMIEDIPRAGTVLNRSTEGTTGGYY